MAPVVSCPNCGSTRNPVGATTCSACGTSLPKGMTPLSPSTATLTASGGRKYPLSTATTTLVGSRGCAILLSGSGVEAQHAKIVPSGGGFLIEPVMGTVFVNGKNISAAVPLSPGANIKLGSQLLTYAGPGTALAPVAPKLAPPVLPKVKSLPRVNISWAKPALVATGKFIARLFKPDPKLEGHILMVDGPHMEQPDIDWGGLFLRLVFGLFVLFPIFILLVIFTPSTAFQTALYFILYGGTRSTPQVPVRYLRVQDSTGKQNVVRMKGEMMWGMLSQGDDARFWGRWKSGNLMMDRAENRTTTSQVMLKTTFQKQVTWGITALIFLCIFLNAILPVLASM